MEVENDRQQPLSLAHIPISISFALVEGNIFVDPTAAE
jgi:exosome complex RNA-binding protein Rrp42 (RNase PH superfamily)